MDAADILGAAPRSEFKVRTRPSDVEPKAKGLKGLNREVYALTGSTEGTVEKIQPAVPVFGKKRRLAHKQVQWEWKNFASSARPDLELKHWQKKGVKWEDYPFAKFNKRLTLLAYSDDEYSTLLEAADWTREKTDKLMKMVQHFDMNFLVIQDRWEGAGSVELLKDRFYSVQRALTQARGEESAEKDRDADNILLAKPYDRQYEEARKAAQERAFQRSPEEEKAEQELLERARKIEARIKRLRAADKDKKKGGEDSGPNCVVGGVTLRSTIMQRGTLEKNNMARVLEHIGLHYLPAVQGTEEAYGKLSADVAELLALYQRLSAKRPAASGGRAGEEEAAGKKRPGGALQAPASSVAETGGTPAAKRRKA